jgi:hypothetical protein
VAARLEARWRGGDAPARQFDARDDNSGEAMAAGASDAKEEGCGGSVSRDNDAGAENMGQRRLGRRRWIGELDGAASAVALIPVKGAASSKEAAVARQMGNWCGEETAQREAWE